MKKILVVDDSALMRRVSCDIINSDERLHVEDIATDGLKALELCKKKDYDAIVLDINMPNMDGIAFLKEFKKLHKNSCVIMNSTLTMDGAAITMEALSLGAVDFVHKPESLATAKGEAHKQRLLKILCGAIYGVEEQKAANAPGARQEKFLTMSKKHEGPSAKKKMVAIASSTGGPKALQHVIPLLPADLDAPVLLVQHMPAGFTATLAQRLDELSKVHVKEAEEGEEVRPGTVYISRGGLHMNYVEHHGKGYIHYSNEPNREGVKPCANYMYESLIQSDYDEITCVVLTGMGKDGTEGIKNLMAKKNTYIIAQDAASSTVYGMPKAIAATGWVNEIVTLDEIAKQIILNVGVKQNGR
ncbi:MAG: chemotaxis-specific protein-glutamate methyltransferase CheB [Lachnospiraceae bacterium]|nr:chemotaxis-specific protein-glutamate methyltransferase CheB [Lachnospiraceae bacterium]